MFRNLLAYTLTVFSLIPSALLSCGAALAAAQTFDFPVRSPIARLRYRETAETKGGKQIERAIEIKAQGRVQIPSTASLDVLLTYDGLQSMASLDQLSRATVTGVDAAKLDLEDSQLVHFKSLSPLYNMNLDATLLTDKALPTIGTFKNLRSLRLSGTDIKGNGLENLNKLSNLWVLNISGLNLAPGSLAKLRPLMTHLHDLNVGRTEMGKEDCANLALLKSADSLCCAFNQKIDDSCARYFTGLTKLQYLTINDTAITDKSLPILLKLPALSEVTIRAKDFWRSRAPEKQIGHVKFVDISTKAVVPLDIFGPLH